MTTLVAPLNATRASYTEILRSANLGVLCVVATVLFFAATGIWRSTLGIARLEAPTASSFPVGGPTGSQLGGRQPLFADLSALLTVAKRTDEDILGEMWIPNGAQSHQVPFHVTGKQLSQDINEPSDDGWYPCGGDAYNKGAEYLAGCQYKMLRQDPKTGAAEMFIRTPPSFVWPTHWHTNSEHLLGIVGNTPMFFEDGTQHDIRQGNYVYIPNGLIHSAFCTNEQPCMFLLYTDRPSDFNIVQKPAKKPLDLTTSTFQPPPTWSLK